MRPKGMSGFEIVVDPKTGKAFMKRQNLDDIDLSKLSPEERAKVLARRAKQKQLRDKLMNEASDVEMAAKLVKLEELAKKIQEARALIEKMKADEDAAKAEFESSLNEFQLLMREEMNFLNHQHKLSKAFLYAYIESLFKNKTKAGKKDGKKATKKKKK